MDKAFLAGRILFSVFFIRGGVNGFFNLDRLSSYVMTKGVPLPDFAVFVASSLLLLGGLSILTGFYPKIGAYLLIAFLIPVTIITHDFWNVDDAAAASRQLSGFLRNVTYTGGCLVLLSLPEPWAYSLRIGKK